MLKLEPVQELIRYALHSSSVKNEKPLSIVLVAPVEAGKTTIIRKYCLKTDGIFYTTDATAYGIIRDTNALRDFEEGRFSHIVVPDLLNCLARKESTVNSFIHFMNSMIEEGVVNISTYATKIQQADKRKVEINVGLITSIASLVFEDKRHRWNKIGFLSRVLPVSYDYAQPTIVEILRYIEDENHLREQLEKLKVKKRKVDVEISHEITREIEPYSLSLSKAQNLYGFRLQRQFQTLLKSIALADDDSSVVLQKHFDTFKELVRFINLDYTRI